MCGQVSFLEGWHADARLLLVDSDALLDLRPEDRLEVCLRLEDLAEGGLEIIRLSKQSGDRQYCFEVVRRHNCRGNLTAWTQI